MAQHAEIVMSQPSSRSNSRHSSDVDLREGRYHNSIGSVTAGINGAARRDCDVTA